MSLPPGTIHKRVSFSFAGHTVLLDLSQDVFSSYDVDRGTRLLLKSLSEPAGGGGAGRYGVPFSPCGCSSVLDVGCGAGVLGIALKTAYPKVDLWGVDRDAFAVGLSEHNAALNGIRDAHFRGALGMGLGETEARWDLIVSNLPAKAGNPVLREMLRCFAASHTDGGRAAVVVVKTLEGEVADVLTDLGAELLLRSGGTGHTVLHFRRPDGDRCEGGVRGRCIEGSLEPYIRQGRQGVRHESKGVAVPLATVYNVPDFDSLGYAPEIAAEILARLRPEGSALIWGPGQGFVPAFLARSPYAAIERYTLASRDLLSLRISGQNLEAAGVERKNMKMSHAAGYPGLLERFDLQILFPEIRTGGGSWHGAFQRAAVRAMEPRGRLLLVAESAVVHRLLKRFGDLRTIAGRKKRGFRGVLLERKE